MMITVEEVRALALALPGTEEQEHWDKPSFRVNNKIYAVLQEDGISLLVKTTKEERAAFTTLDPEVYAVPANYSTLNYMLIRMDRVKPGECRDLLVQSWRLVSPKRIVAAYDASRRA
ncbi:MmcQ/YjbR family DNA-binding protein [Paenibacillus sp. HJGM_3]|uniref:MmcQ/YjbR family DNA-binding protein n=1 Tax=Paenibacillus sp. HJGM_3 TaxID=3379816 RepID=UPI00385AADC0